MPQIAQNEATAANRVVNETAVSSAGAYLTSSSLWFWDLWLKKAGGAFYHAIDSSPIRGGTAATATQAPTAPAATAIGDLVIVYHSGHASAAPTLTIQSGFTSIQNQQLTDGTTSHTFGVAYKVATVAGAQTYQAYSASGGTSYAGIVVLKTGYYTVTGIQSSQNTTATNNTTLSGASVTLNQKKIVLSFRAWDITSAASNTPTAPNNYTLINEVAGSVAVEVASSYRMFKTASASSETVGTYGGVATSNNQIDVTVALTMTPLTQENVSYDDETNAPGHVTFQLSTTDVDTRGLLKGKATNTGSTTDAVQRDFQYDIVVAGGDATAANQTTILARLPAALVSGRIDASVGAYQTGLAPLQPTTAGRTLDVTAGGEAGIDWANIGSPTTVVGLSGTTIKNATDNATTEAAIKLKTDNLPSDPADASDIAAAFSTVNSTLSTIAGYVDTEVAAIKAKTDQLNFSGSNVLAKTMAMDTDVLTSSALASSAVSEIAAAISGTAGLPLNQNTRWKKNEANAAKRRILIKAIDSLGAPADARVLFSGTNELLVDPSSGSLASAGGTLANVTAPLTFSDTTFTADATTDVMTAAAHGRKTGDLVQTTNSGGALPTALAVTTNYYVIWRSVNTFQLASSLSNALAGTAINITTNGTGTNKIVSVAGSRQLVDGLWNYTASQAELNIDGSYFGVRLFKAASTGSATAVDDTAGTSTLTGSGFLSRHVGRSITVAGFSTGANNGTFTIAAVSNDGTTCTYANASGADETHAATWTIDDGVPSVTVTAELYENEIDMDSGMGGKPWGDIHRGNTAIIAGRANGFQSGLINWVCPFTGKTRWTHTIVPDGRSDAEEGDLT